MAASKINVIVDHPFGSLVFRQYNGIAIWLGFSRYVYSEVLYGIMIEPGKIDETAGEDWTLLNEAE